MEKHQEEELRKKPMGGDHECPLQKQKPKEFFLTNDKATKSKWANLQWMEALREEATG